MTTATQIPVDPVDFSFQRYHSVMRAVWPWPAMLLEKTAEWIKVLPKDTWLDAACGEGQLADLIGRHQQIVGLDIEPVRLRRAQHHPYDVLIQASITSLPFAGGSLGGIVSVETLEHVAEISLALTEFSRCIKPNGYLLITMPSVTLRSLWQMRRSGEPVYCDADRHVRELSAVEMKGFQHHFQRLQWLEHKLAYNGFVVRRRGGVGCLLPMWRGWFGFMEHAMNLLYRERINNLLTRLPGLNQFAYYQMFLARLEKS
jgi:SAM-dependent methyltransferase